VLSLWRRGGGKRCLKRPFPGSKSALTEQLWKGGVGESFIARSIERIKGEIKSHEGVCGEKTEEDSKKMLLRPEKFAEKQNKTDRRGRTEG